MIIYLIKSAIHSSKDISQSYQLFIDEITRNSVFALLLEKQQKNISWVIFDTKVKG